MKAWVLGDPVSSASPASRCRCRKRPRCWCVSMRWRSARPIWKSSITARRHPFRVACRTIKISRPATNIWARWRHSTRRRRIQNRPARRGRNSRRLRPVQALPRRHVYRLPQLRPQLRRCRQGHRANGFTTDGGFCEYQVNNINTLVAIQDDMSDEEGTLVVTAAPRCMRSPNLAAWWPARALWLPAPARSA